jgi:hypothetical protein
MNRRIQLPNNNIMSHFNYDKISQPTEPKPIIPTSYSITKAGKNGIIICTILDESGSMSTFQNQTIAGYNEFIEGQQKSTIESGMGVVTLIKFDAPKIKTVYQNMPLDSVPSLTKETYSPYGGTNLMDGIATGVVSVDKYLSGMAKNKRPGVIFVIITDGYENSSKFYTNAEIKLIVTAAEKSDWTFTFLGANIDAFAAGASIGMSYNNTLAYDTKKMGETFSILNTSAISARMMKSSGSSTAEIYEQGMYSEKNRSDVV